MVQLLDPFNDFYDEWLKHCNLVFVLLLFGLLELCIVLVEQLLLLHYLLPNLLKSLIQLVDLLSRRHLLLLVWLLRLRRLLLLL